MPGNPQVAARMRKAAALMRARGLRVSAMAGWEDRGRSADFAPRAVLLHHTAAAVDVDRILRDGRPDLSGPLCNWAVHRNGGWVLVAAGRANHAGVGTLPNSASYGVEATGPDPAGASGPAAFGNYGAYVLGVACILAAEGWDTSAVFGHKETARPVGRKVDPAFSVPDFEAAVRAAMAGEEEDDMTPDEHKALLDTQAAVGRLIQALRVTEDGQTVDQNVSYQRLYTRVGDLVGLVKAGVPVKLDLSSASPQQLADLGKAIADNLEIKDLALSGSVDLHSQAPGG
jgi:hypothetical protein